MDPDPQPHLTSPRHRALTSAMVAVVVVLSGATSAAAQARPGAPVGDSVVPPAIAASDAARTSAEAARDTAALGRLLAPDYYWVAPDGELLGRSTRLYRIARGVRATDSIVVLGRPFVRRIADSLVIVTRASVVWGRRGGHAIAGKPLRDTKLYVNRGGSWLLLFQQGSELAPEHAPAPGWR